MKKEQVEVFSNALKSDTNPKGSCGMAEYPVYETLDEAVTAVGAERVLERFNAQIKTDARNDKRTAAQPNQSKKMLRKEALKRVTNEEFQQVAGDPDAFDRLIDEKVKIIMAERGIEEDND